MSPSRLAGMTAHTDHGCRPASAFAFLCPGCKKTRPGFGDEATVARSQAGMTLCLACRTERSRKVREDLEVGQEAPDGTA